MIHADEIKRHVRDHYARRAGGGNCCGGSRCCGSAAGAADATARGSSAVLDEFIGPSLGCGSPLEHARVRPGEVVVDLGSGAGREVLLAARQAGPQGRAIGIDMTPEMIWTARENARRLGAGNAEFYLGEIEHLPLADATADVVISNCVINLVPDKGAVFREAYRVLRPGGRLVISDVVSDGPLPEQIRSDPDAWAACIAGALDAREYVAAIAAAGFVDVQILSEARGAPGQIYSITVRARKPA